jgi:hypothetical protein
VLPGERRPHEAVKEVPGAIFGFDGDPGVFDADIGDAPADQLAQDLAGLEHLGLAERVGFDVVCNILGHIDHLGSSCKGLGEDRRSRTGEGG